MIRKVEMYQAVCDNCGKNGVEYYLKNTWHDKSEIPEYGRCILVKTKSYGVFVGGKNLSEKDYKTFVKEAEVESWAYIEDLLTNK